MAVWLAIVGEVGCCGVSEDSQSIILRTDELSKTYKYDCIVVPSPLRSRQLLDGNDRQQQHRHQLRHQHQHHHHYYLQHHGCFRRRHLLLADSAHRGPVSSSSSSSSTTTDHQPSAFAASGPYGGSASRGPGALCGPLGPRLRHSGSPSSRGVLGPHRGRMYMFVVLSGCSLIAIFF